ncbi:unnamed protein product [Cuscuta europaea]|uniref:Uncharacterized protein n=1 Tax=Cuscuta europaea TaxID=41803 RepID=A0A9P0YUU1_CUSEU|nr:unnamed protein product [Cuscuta europaea]
MCDYRSVSVSRCISPLDPRHQRATLPSLGFAIKLPISSLRISSQRIIFSLCIFSAQNHRPLLYTSSLLCKTSSLVSVSPPNHLTTTSPHLTSNSPHRFASFESFRRSLSVQLHFTGWLRLASPQMDGLRITISEMESSK